MLSIIAYGRNDSYGYRLEKRAALSMNSWGELLDPDRGDEIVFCDYNSPDELPTFPEAIADTLTPRTRSLLRVVRVRPREHRRWASLTHLVALESVARNAAVRRTRPDNRWVLSTNTDMVFRFPAGRLAEQLQHLEDGFYQLPRFELPEALWSEWDRLDPAGYHAQIDQLAEPLGLDHVMLSRAVLVDAPGDFQLALRTDYFGVAGFDEDMLHGWHVDSNFTQRMALWRSRPAQLLPLPLRGYHCGHTLVPTAAHAGVSIENEWGRFVTGLHQADLTERQPDWGLADVELEDFRVDERQGRIARTAGRAAALLARMEVPPREYDSAGDYDFGRFSNVPVATLLAHTTALFASMPPDGTVAWSGGRADVFAPVREALRREGRTGSWLLDDECDLLLECPELAAEPDVSVVDFAALPQLRPDVVVVEAALPDSTLLARHSRRDDQRAQAQRVLQQLALDIGDATGEDWDPLVVGVGVAGTHLQGVHSALFSVAQAPPGTGVRLGRMPRTTPPGRTMKDLAHRVSQATGGHTRWTPGQFSEVVQHVRTLADGGPADVPDDVLEHVRALAADPDAAIHLDLPRWSLEAGLSRLRPAEPAVPEEPTGAVRAYRVEDLHDPQWRRLATTVLGHLPLTLRGHQAHWLLATVMQELLTRTRQRRSVVLVSDDPGHLLPVLAPFCDHLTTLDGRLSPSTPRSVPGGGVDSRRLVQDAGAHRWDAVVADLATTSDLEALGAVATALGSHLLLGYQGEPALVLPLGVTPAGLHPLHTSTPRTELPGSPVDARP